MKLKLDENLVRRWASQLRDAGHDVHTVIDDARSRAGVRLAGASPPGDAEAIATDRDYRWDGVHRYSRGAALILETVDPALLAIPV